MKYLDNFTKFDTVTNFRILNRFIVTIGLCMLIPLAIDLKGEQLSAMMITVLVFMETIAVKAHRYLTKFDISQLYKLGMAVHTLLLLVLLTYFYDKTLFIVLFSLVTISEIAVFGAFSIQLDVYQSKYFHNQVQTFKVIRNSVSADATIIGLIIAGILSTKPEFIISTAFLYHGIFSIYFLYNWNYITNNMLRD